MSEHLELCDQCLADAFNSPAILFTGRANSAKRREFQRGTVGGLMTVAFSMCMADGEDFAVRQSWGDEVVWSAVTPSKWWAVVSA